MLKQTFVAVSALLLAACANDPAEEGSLLSPAVVSPQTEAVVPGLFRIKLAPQAGVLRTGDFTRGEGSGCPAFDAAATRAGVREVKRSLPDGGRFRERHRRAGLDRWYEVAFPADLPVREAMARFGSLSEIEVMEPVYRMVPADMEASAGTEALFSFAIPQFDDPLLKNQWCYRNEGSFPGHVAGADLNVYPAWSAATGSSDVIVAVFDGGIDYTHPDLADNMWTDGEGHYGYDFCGNKPEVDPSPHGTRIAGMIGAVNNNGLGVCGIAGGDGTPGSGVKMMSCQVFGEGSADIMKMMVWAADRGAVISQNSWNYVGLSDLSQYGKDAIDYFIEHAGCDENGNQTGPMKGGVVIFAAGNDNTNTPQFPAAYEPVIAVGSLRPDYRKVPSSNYGSWVDVCALGGESTGTDGCDAPYTTDMGGGYIFASGTSMACPQVSGIAALAVSYYAKMGPGFTAEELRRLLVGSGRLEEVLKRNPGYSATDFGTGLADAEYVVFHDAVPDRPADLKAELRNGVLELSWIIPGDHLSRAIRDYDVYVSAEPFTESETDRATKYETVGYGTVGTRTGWRGENLPQAETYYLAVAARSKYGIPSAPAFATLEAGKPGPGDPDPVDPTQPGTIAEPTFYPNPFTDRLNVRLSAPEGTCRIMLYDRAGRMALQAETAIAGHTGAVDTRVLSPGNYRAVLEWGGQTFERTVVKR
ncbi:S8 family serine peptidase [uncultured Alistipes sp.]|uniref:S8 family serine peptidase n=1 Tax=uncultured Alistipes sp. TaxID=538949 RepID=UPI00261E95B4|nr:S8 family serine peptidase [uncultured Alistipes sp.]